MPNQFNLKFKGKEKWGKYPNKCPICHHNITLNNHNMIVVKEDDIQVGFICPNEECKNIFICFYSDTDDKFLNQNYFEPSKVESEEFPEIIKSVSPTFHLIFQEAEEARNRNLLQIAGPGYRKAFEFLIKDYAKSKINKNDEKYESKITKIERSFSGSVIKDFIDDPRIQTVATRALWVGNDETHYLRKWEKHDINDLITLIKLTINWIEIEVLSSKYIKDMPDNV